MAFNGVNCPGRVLIQKVLTHGLCLLALILCQPRQASAESHPMLEVATFSSAAAGKALPDGWQPYTFKKIPKHTAYELVEDGGVRVVRAVSDASASGLIRRISINPKQYPILRWRWKVEHLLQRSDVTRKQGDDFPARLYITFAYEPDKVSFGRKLKYKLGQKLFGDVPIAALNYVWDTKAAQGSIHKNAYTDFARMVIIRSGPQQVGQWVEEQRNVYEDYRRAFGGEPPMISGVAVMTDTDDTRERATAFYGDIAFLQAGK
jgi:hypothetical protein